YTDRLRGGERSRSARNLDVEPVFVPEAHTLGDESEEAAALRHPGQGEFDRLLVLGEDQAGESDAPCGAERGRSRAAKKPATRQSANDAHDLVSSGYVRPGSQQLSEQPAK